jgi:hypothetical protein
MPNHIHALLRTPESNLAAGMQHWLSGYANWYAKRHRKSGHLFQGRYKSFLVEDASYFWSLSRYIHLNPCIGSRPLAERPEQWKQSSYAGYAHKRARKPFVQYDQLHKAWTGKRGGKDPVAAYRRYVIEGLGAVENPLTSALRDWVIGSEKFLRRMVTLAEKQDASDTGQLRRRMKVVAPAEILSKTAAVHGVDTEAYVGFRSPAAGREIAALLCRRYTGVSLATLSATFGLRHPDSASNLVRKAKKRAVLSVKYRKTIATVERALGVKTENQV